MKKIYLIRHAEEEYGVLTRRGEQQADITGRYLAELEPRGIGGLYTSNIKRARETAERISIFFGNIPVVENEYLRERLNFEEYPQNTYFGDFLKDWDRTLQERAWQPPYGDSSINAGRRLDIFLQSLPHATSDKGVYIIIAHCGIIADLLRNRFPPDRFNPGMKDGKISRTNGIANCSITTLLMERDNYSIKKIASTEHLENKVNS